MADAQHIPAGMVEVTKERFWALVMAEKRDIHPTSYRNHTWWNFNGTERRWGWSSEGFAPSRQHERFAVVARGAR